MRLTSSATQQSTDRDGLMMLILAVSGIVLSGGLFWLWRAMQTYQTARHAMPKLPQSHPASPDEHPIQTWILFGKQLRNDLPDYDFQQRLQAALRLTEEGSHPHSLLLLGGKTANNKLSEAQAAADYLLICRPELFPSLVLEEASRNTLENLKQARTYLRSGEKRVALISNRYHLHRCTIMAKGFGLETLPVAAESKWRATPTNLLKIALEGFFIHWYHTGAFISKILKNQRMLNKIH